MTKKALITGISSEDGSFLAELLLAKAYEAFGLRHRVAQIRLDELYHLAAQSHVRVSFDLPADTSEITGPSTVPLLEAIHRADFETRFYSTKRPLVTGVILKSPLEQRETANVSFRAL